MGEPPQKILNKQLVERSDLLVGVFWTRIGTPTAEHPSGSVEEIEEHLSARKPVMLYFSNQPVRLDSVNAEQYQRLLDFKASCKDRGLYEEYEDIASFREKFFRQLQLKLNEDEFFKRNLRELLDAGVLDQANVSIKTIAAQPELSNDAKALLAAAAGDDGHILRTRTNSGGIVQAAGRNFVEGNDRRSIARWESAVDELEREDLIEDKAGRGELYFITHDGYRIADALPKGT